MTLLQKIGNVPMHGAYPAQAKRLGYFYANTYVMFLPDPRGAGHVEGPSVYPSIQSLYSIYCAQLIAD